MQKNNHIVFIISGLGSGGAERMLVSLITEIKQNHNIDQEIYVLTKNLYFKPKLDEINVNVHIIEIGFNFSWIPKTFKLIKKIREKKSIVSTWLYHADIFGGIIGKIAGARRIIWSIRQDDVSIQKNSFSIFCIIRLCAFFSKIIPHSIISCSAKARDTHIKIGYPEKNFCHTKRICY